MELGGGELGAVAGAWCSGSIPGPLAGLRPPLRPAGGWRGKCPQGWDTGGPVPFWGHPPWERDGPEDTGAPCRG